MSYTAFTQKQFETVLPPGWQVWRPDVRVGEIVYAWEPSIPSWRIECYSGIAKSLGTSRDVGEDAIRFVLFDRVSGRGISSATRVHRTGTVDTLRARLLDRYEGLIMLMTDEEAARCRTCGAATVRRQNRATGQWFRGCARWKECAAKKVLPGA